MSNFPYQPLDRDKQEIRFLVLQNPGKNLANVSTEPTSCLKCQLIVRSLRLYTAEQKCYIAHKVDSARNFLKRNPLDNPSFPKHFHALPYVWGDASATCDTEINGQATETGANLHAALRAIQRNTSHRIIWADALCINQSDNEEKSWQAQQMGVIFAHARTTISWLGPSSADSNLALKTLVKLDNSTRGEDWSIHQATEGYSSGPSIQKNLSRISQDDSVWTACALAPTGLVSGYSRK